MFDPLAFLPHPFQLGMQQGRPFLQPVFGVDAVLALEGVESEIGEKRNGDNRDYQGPGPSFLALACPHGDTSYKSTRISCHHHA